MTPMGQWVAEERDALRNECHGFEPPVQIEPPYDWSKDLMIQMSARRDSWFAALAALLPERNYWYLASKMSGLPGYNYAEFIRIASLLRQRGYAFANPAEFEHEKERAAIISGESDGPLWQDCLARDVAIVAHPECAGIIVFGDWKDSRGALLETEVASSLGKPIFEFSESDDGSALIYVDRESALAAYEHKAES